MLKAKGYKKGSIVGDVFSLKKLFGKNAGNHLLSADHASHMEKHGLKWYKAQLIPITITRICNFKKTAIITKQYRIILVTLRRN
jgi:hypothetical protein